VSWLDGLQNTAKEKSKEKFAERELKPTWFCIITRRPTDNDPGQVAEGWYVLSADLVVTLTDQDGKPIENVETAIVEDPKHAPAAASRLLSEHRAGGSDFNRRLSYGKTVPY
jgi:hypothetical protein